MGTESTLSLFKNEGGRASKRASLSLLKLTRSVGIPKQSRIEHKNTIVVAEMTLLSTYLLGVAPALTLLYLLYKLAKVGSRPSDLPPGPPTLPFIGNLHLVSLLSLPLSVFPPQLNITDALE